MNMPGGKDARTRDDDKPMATSTSADVTSRMAGTHESGDHDTHDRTHDGEHHGKHAATAVETERYEERARILPAKTSAAATFALVFGLAALFCALTAILAPLGVLFGLIGIILGIAGMKMAKRSGVTGKGVAIGGLVTAVLGLLLGGAVLAGAAVVVNDEAQLDRITNWIEDVRNDIPSAERLENQLTN